MLMNDADMNCSFLGVYSLEQCCSLEFSVMMEIFYFSAVQLWSYLPHRATEYFRCATENLSFKFYLILISLNLKSPVASSPQIRQCSCRVHHYEYKLPRTPSSSITIQPESILRTENGSQDPARSLILRQRFH